MYIYIYIYNMSMHSMPINDPFVQDAQVCNYD